jgi:N-acetylneuraminic acid mutarotase
LVTLALVAVALSFAAPGAEAAWGYAWDTEPALGAPAAQSVVVSDADGLVYIMGGATAASYAAVDAAYSYDPDSGEWTVLASMDMAARGSAGAIGLDGRVYVISGYLAGYLDLIQIYDPGTDTWSTGAAVPVPTWEAKAVTLANGSICVVGGEGAPAGLVQIYDSVADSWSVGPSAPLAIRAGALIIDGDDLYYSGGGVGGSAATTTFLKYDGALGEWVVLTDLPSARAGHAMVLGVDGMIYVIGGAGSSINGASGYATVDAYDPVAEEWSSVSTMDEARTYLGATVTTDGRILALGGSDAGIVTEVTDVVESLQMYLFDCSAELSSSSVRAGDSVLLTVDPQFEYAVEHNSSMSWYLVSDADGILYDGGSVMNPTPGPIAVTIEVSILAAPGEYTVVIESVEAWGLTVYDRVEMLEIPLTVLPAATPAADLIADLEAQIVALESSLADLGDAMDTADADLMTEISALQSQVSDLEDALAALETSMSSDNQDLADEIAALQDQVGLLQNSLDNVSAEVSSDDGSSNTMNYVVIILIIVVILLLVFMMFVRPKSALPPPPMS